MDPRYAEEQIKDTLQNTMNNTLYSISKSYLSQGLANEGFFNATANSIKNRVNSFYNQLLQFIYPYFFVTNSEIFYRYLCLFFPYLWMFRKEKRKVLLTQDLYIPLMNSLSYVCSYAVAKSIKNSFTPLMINRRMSLVFTSIAIEALIFWMCTDKTRSVNNLFAISIVCSHKFL